MHYKRYLLFLFLCDDAVLWYPKMETRLATNNAKRLYYKHGLKLFSVYFYYNLRYSKGSRGSSVSIVSGYGMDDQAIEVRSPAEARGFFL
jgi:hypothetical protein